MRYSLSLISFGRPMIIAFTPFLHLLYSFAAMDGRRLLFRRIVAPVTMRLYGAEDSLTAPIVLQSGVGAFLQRPAGRLQYLILLRDPVAKSRRRLASLQTDVQKG